MDIVIGHETALEFWRSPRGNALFRAGALKRKVPPSFLEAPASRPAMRLPVAVRTDLGALASCFSQKPLHLIVPHAACRTRRKDVVCHVMTGKVATSHFYKIAEGVYASSPEAVFAQAAAVLQVEHLIQLGFELCGTYRRSPLFEGGCAFDQPVLASVAALGTCLEATPGARGGVAGRRALPYVLAASASPMETVVAMLLCLPPRWGGYGLPLPQMNDPVSIPSGVRGVGVGRPARCDLYWKSAKLDVEYDGRVHDSPNEHARDAARRTALGYKGITVITVRREQLYSQAEFDKMVVAIRRHLGVRVRPQASDWQRKMMKLRATILP